MTFKRKYMPCITKSTVEEIGNKSSREPALFSEVENNKNSELTPDSQEENSAKTIEVNKELVEPSENIQSPISLICHRYYLLNTGLKSR